MFSERKGLWKPRTEIQIESMNEALRNRLWNIFEIHYIQPMEGASYYGTPAHAFEKAMGIVIVTFYDSYLKEKVDTAPIYHDGIRDFARNLISQAQWFRVYDFFEFVIANLHYKGVNEAFIKDCNRVLESELSAYRFVGGFITEVTSKEEISTIEEALETPIKTVSVHLENALKLMSDKKSPDYRNSIKESISSVEAICRFITKQKNATLGDALDIMEKEGKIELHGALKRAFDSLYGYASTAEGIRHALTEEKVKVDFDDAKFILVSCSAFVNYLTSKVSKAGLQIG